MDETLLELLCAPLSHAALRLVTHAELDQINAGIRQRSIRNRDGLILDRSSTVLSGANRIEPVTQSATVCLF